jgi:Flp pilus assembly protein TadD
MQAKAETTQAKADAAQALADREKDKEERDLLQGILNRSLTEQNRREKARKDLVAEVSRLKVSSDALMKQIGLLGEPVLQLNEKEQALFKQPLVEISAEGISISAMKTPPKGGTKPSATDGKDSPKQEDNAPKADASASKTAKLGPLSDEVRGKISEAKDRFDKGDFVNAEKLYKEVLDQAPGNAFVLSNLGVAQFRGKRYPEAEESLKKALELAPEDAFSRSTLGIVFYTQGKLDKAVDELTQSVSINPNNAVAHNYLGIAASRKGWQENARKELETAAELDPTYADAYFNLAVVCASQKPPDKDAARNAYQKATALGAAPDTRLEELIR